MKMGDTLLVVDNLANKTGGMALEYGPWLRLQVQRVLASATGERGLFRDLLEAAERE